MSLVPWGVVLDLQSVLLVTHVVRVNEDRSSLGHSRSDLELHTVGDWRSLVFNNNLEVNSDEGPALVGSVVAVPEDDASILSVATTVDIEALATVVSDVSLGTSVDSDSLVDLVSPLSDDSRVSDVELLAGSVGDGEFLVRSSSDGSGSGVEHEPELLVKLLVVLQDLDVELVDSQSELVSTDVFVPEQEPARFHVGLDVEHDIVGQWLMVSWLTGDGVDSPAHVDKVVAIPPDDRSVIQVG